MIPNERSKQLIILLDKLRSKTPNIVTPLERREVYASLRQISFDQQLYFGRLSVITANYAIETWKGYYADTDFPIQFLVTANKIILNEIKKDIGQSIAQKGWNWLEELGAKTSYEPGSEFFFAASATWEALMEVTGKDPFYGVKITETTNDDDLDPWSSDTTKWASYAYNLGSGTGSANIKRFSNFYSWWLNIAIPKALDLTRLDLLD